VVGRIDRRLFLGRLTKGAAAVAVLGFAACSDDPEDALTPRTTTTSEGETVGTTTSTAAPQVTTSAAPADPATTTAPPPDVEPAQIERVSLGFVSAFVFARAGEATVVDTGVSGSEGQIEAGLTALGLGWGDVGHVVLTHLHPDHVGSLTAVMEAAADAAGYAGAADIPSIDAPRELTAVGDGDTVMDLTIIETPGHTPGSISVFDLASGIIVVGDAMNGGDAMGGEAGTVAGANPQFTPDIATADASIEKISVLPFDEIYFGHGEPVIGDASVLVREFALEL
jgi:glyoxylase-like metal-dependent hydrolase (beta-lactamase superfamily II)